MANAAPVPAPAKENRFIAQAKDSLANAAPVPAPAKENRFIAQAKDSLANAAPVPAPAKENRFIAQAKKEETIAVTEPRAQRRTMNNVIGTGMVSAFMHFISWLATVVVGFWLTTEIMKDRQAWDSTAHFQAWAVLAPLFQVAALFLVFVPGTCCNSENEEVFWLGYPPDGWVYSQMLGFALFAGFGLSILVGTVYDAFVPDGFEGLGGAYIVLSANATGFALINLSRQIARRMRNEAMDVARDVALMVIEKQNAPAQRA